MNVSMNVKYGFSKEEPSPFFVKDEEKLWHCQYCCPEIPEYSNMYDQSSEWPMLEQFLTQNNCDTFQMCNNEHGRLCPLPTAI